MSVPKSKQGEGEMRVMTAANALAVYTLNKCANERNFPKRYRWCLVSKIVDNSLNICLNIVKANAAYVKTAAEYELRREYQDEALAETYSLLTLMQIAYADKERFRIGDCIEHWTGLVAEVQDLIRKWRKSDEERYKGLQN